MEFQYCALDAKKTFKASSTAEVQFNKALRKLAKSVGQIINMHTDGARIIDEKALMKQLKDYSEAIGPWARLQSEKLLQQVSSANKRAFNNRSKKIAQSLNVVAESNVGMMAALLMEEQVYLIKSIPLEAGQRAQKIAMENILQGKRASVDPEILKLLVEERRNKVKLGEFGIGGSSVYAEEMARSEEVAINRAKLIAVTETAKANAAFTEARAVSVGATKYKWHTTMDGAERHSHALMNGKIIEYSKPPLLSDGTRGHAGTFPRCRCWQEPIFDDEN